VRWNSQLSFARLLCAGLAMLAWTAAPALAGEKASAMVIDANTGRILYDKAGSEPRFPASLTKMMTLYLAFETIEAGRLNFSSPLTVSEHAANAAPSKLGLESGSEITVRDAIKALVVKSANDMAIAMAEKISGNEEAFAKLMTKRARQIGMSDTTFQNASGLPDPEQVTTARDMLTLAMRLQDDFPQHYRLFATRAFSYGGKTYRTHNALLGRFPGVDGIKTGYTRASGFNLVSSYRAGGKHVVAAVFGGASAGLRDAHMRMLLARAIDKASTERSRKSAPQLIAEAQPAKRPAAKAAAKPEPRSAPAPAPVVVAAAEPAALSISPPSDALPPKPTPVTVAPTIAIAKVRTVSVLQQNDSVESASLQIRPPATTTASAAADPTAAAALSFAGTSTRPDFAALKAELLARAAESSDADATHPALPAASPALFAQPTPDAAGLIAAKVDRARPPSTLQAQLASFTADPDPLNTTPTGTRPALRSAVAEMPAPVPVPVSTGVSRTSAGPAPTSGFHVQIGVYSSPSDAERAMANARERAGHVLDDRAPIAVPLNKGDKQLYRARFAGFDSASATSACNELRRNGLDCFVARPN
jgi:D-alanyl-D-alanine carboxypeptidase